MKNRENINYVMPDVDIYENDNNFTIFVDLPGVPEKNVNVNVESDILTITAESKVKIKDEYKPLYGGRQKRAYRRSFNLKNSVDTENVIAELKDGVLALSLAKKEEVKPKRIKVNKAGDKKLLGFI